MLSLLIATVLSSLEQGNSLAAVVENCPTNIRYSGIAFSYNLGMALFGGTAPLIVTFLTEKINIIAPAYYLIFMATISLIAITTLLSKTSILDFLKPVSHLIPNEA
jgi:MHS family proline/betaine transporter-like MFS transporter